MENMEERDGQGAAEDEGKREVRALFRDVPCLDTTFLASWLIVRREEEMEGRETNRKSAAE